MFRNVCKVQRKKLFTLRSANKNHGYGYYYDINNYNTVISNEFN